MPAQTVIKFRRDTAANWATTNPTLAAGEVGLETDTGLVKYGNGTSTWTALIYPSNSNTTYLVRNNTGATISKGTLVTATGAEPSGRIDVAPFEVTGLQDSELRVMGIATADIASGVNGTVMSFGTLTGLDTRGTVASALAVGDEDWDAGDILYAHPTVDGKLTKVRPKHDLAVAFITVSHATTGQISIRIVPGNFHLEWMHDVALSSPTLGQMLVYDGTNWVNTGTLQAVTDSTIPLIIKGAASQTSRLTQWQNSAGTELAYVQASGTFITNNAINAGGIGTFGNASGLTTAQLNIVSTSGTRVGALVRGAAAQTANLQEWQDSASSIIARINPSGDFHARSFLPNATVNPATLGMHSSGANNLDFSTSSTRRMNIGSSGTVTVFLNLVVGTSAGGGAAAIEVGGGRGTDGSSYVDLISDSVAYTDYSSRIIRNSGSNGLLSIANRGTGGIEINSQEAGQIALRTTTVNRLVVAATGEVSIGDAPIASDMLYVNTTTAANTGLVIRGVTSQTGNLQEWQNTGGTVLSRVDASGRFVGDGSQLTGIQGESFHPFMLMGA
jgi:hypothetical protein